MNGMLRRCLLMSIGALALAGVLLAAGVPGAVLLGFAPLAACLGMHLLMGHQMLMGHGDSHGQDLLATARHANVPRDGRADASDPAGPTR